MKENKKLRTIVIVSGIAIFFGILLIYYLAKLDVFSEDNKKTTVLNDRVIFEQPKLTIFDETRYLNAFPDTIRIHYPYLIVAVPEDTKKITTVYSLEEKKEVASYNDIVLDYYDGNFLYNYHGGKTYFKQKDLKLHCDHGFIKSETEILCITAKASDPLDNKLLSINPQTLSKNDLYSSQNTLTAVSFVNNMLFIGEYNFAKNKAYITLNNDTSPNNDLINIIYPIGDKVYAGSFKSLRNNKTESYSEIQVLYRQIRSTLVEKGEIVFYQYKDH